MAFDFTAKLSHLIDDLWNLIFLSFYRRDYGFLGVTLQQAVSKVRNQPPPAPKPSSSGSSGSSTTNPIPQSSNTSTTVHSVTNVAQTPPIRPNITPRFV